MDTDEVNLLQQWISSVSLSSFLPLHCWAPVSYLVGLTFQFSWLDL